MTPSTTQPPVNQYREQVLTQRPLGNIPIGKMLSKLASQLIKQVEKITGVLAAPARVYLQLAKQPLEVLDDALVADRDAEEIRNAAEMLQRNLQGATQSAQTLREAIQDTLADQSELDRFVSPNSSELLRWTARTSPQVAQEYNTALDAYISSTVDLLEFAVEFLEEGRSMHKQALETVKALTAEFEKGEGMKKAFIGLNYGFRERIMFLEGREIASFNAALNQLDADVSDLEKRYWEVTQLPRAEQ